TLSLTIVENVKKHAKTVVVTGGEPLMWNMDFLTSELKNAQIKTHIETSGAYPLSGSWDWICLSPKKTKLPLSPIYKVADELKIIIQNKQDFKFAEEQAAKVTEKCELFLQPEWSKRELMTPLIVDYVMKNPQWKISLQTHKYLNIP
ncbi:MAG: 7-carboxy-7-deazaguanine synthase QueE, partial [Flavobacteriaceae bacterium]|nr:7-carboxy-7-deazaguanine synthase QueE [Flavobacteriaceae bacterium]